MTRSRQRCRQPTYADLLAGILKDAALKWIADGRPRGGVAIDLKWRRHFAERVGVFDSQQMLRSIKKTLGSKRFSAGKQEQRELVEHVSNKIYYNWLALDGSPRDLVNVLREDAYVSLDSGLREYGISTQSPRTLTCVTTERAKEFKARTITISYRSISPRFYWGSCESRLDTAAI
jgi:hypothetical protein